MPAKCTATQEEPDQTHETLQQRNQLLDELLLEKYEPIAVVGIGLRFPGSNETPADFAEFLRAGRSGTGPIPTDRWDVDGFASGDFGTKGKVHTVGGGFLDEIDQFDPVFFNISPKEAQYVDPQQRLVLETAWEALENANIDPTTLRHSNGGVYVGVSCVDYTLEVDALSYEELDAHIGTGTAHSAVPGRLSYFLGWRGPSMAIDTACSSSLVSLHLAVEGLRRRECEIALCGGVNAIHHPRNHIVFSQAKMLAPDGRCKTFDGTADGYSRSEGCAMVVLKRMSDAKRDGDLILALVRGTAVRQDGESGGLTVPNGSAQEGVMRAALDSAMLEPGDIQYVEAHGTGTALGDPIEMGAIRAVFAGSRSKADPVIVGSLKTNVGHMEAAAGIGGVVKTILQLFEAEIYPHLHLDKPSDHIPWDNLPVTVPTRGRPWTADSRRALVNSFGFAGTIATAVLEQAPPSAGRPDSGRCDDAHVFALSAKSKKSLRLQIEKYQRYFATHTGYDLAEVCYTSNVGRSHFNVRLAGVVHDRAELARLLASKLSQLGKDEKSGRDIRKVALLFTGQGSQYPGMGSPLYERYPVFRRHLDESDRLFEPYLGRSIKALMFGDAQDAEQIHQTVYTQPALFALEYAVAQLWLSWGVVPSVLIGHSIGEVVAATVAGLFSHEDAVRLVAARARLMQSVSTPGGMVAVQASADEVAAVLERYPDVAFAAVNAPGQCVVSGGRDSLAEVVETLRERGIATKSVPVSHAFHSPLMNEVLDEFRNTIADIRFYEPELTLVANLTGEVAKPAEISTIEYWVRHIGEPVKFAAGMRAIERRGRHVFVEVGPSAALTSLGKQSLAAEEHLWLSSLHVKDSDGSVIRKALSEFYTVGLPVSWTGYHNGRAGRGANLPTYAFDRKRYWLPISGKRHTKGTAANVTEVHHPLLGQEATTPEQLQSGMREFITLIGPDRPEYLADHVVMGQVVFPAAGYVEMLLALQDAVYGETHHLIEDLQIHEPLLLTEEQLTEVRTRLRPNPDGRTDVEIVSRVTSGDRTIERCHATAAIDLAAHTGSVSALADTGSSIRAQAQQSTAAQDAERTADDLYADFADLGLTYGPEFRRICKLARHGAHISVGELRGQRTAAVEHLPPAILDCVIQSLAAVVDDGHTYLPVRFGQFQLLKKPKGTQLRSLARVSGADPASGELTADLMLLDADRPVFLVRGLGFRRVANASPASRRRLFHEPRWVKRSLVRPGVAQSRHVLVLHRTEADLADLVTQTAKTDTRLSFASTVADTARILRERPSDVCWFWRAGSEAIGEAWLRAECEHNYRDLLELLRLLERERFGRDQRLWLVTEGGQWLADDPAGNGEQLPAATLWGFGQTLWTEYPSYRVTLIDLPAGGTDHQPLLDEWHAAEPDEFQVAYRDGSRHVRRIFPSDFGATRDDNFELAIKEYGEFANVKPVPIEDVSPRDDEIQVRVHAAGLNFKDVLNALGLLKQHATEAGLEYKPLPLGFECSGTVVAVGPMAEFQVGAEVIVSNLGCLRQRITVPSAMAVCKPSNVGFAEAAGLPTAYVTAYHALHDLAGIKPGDRVLIHAAAGGVGQAAVQLAKLAGAEVYATASPRKWPVLRAQGVEYILNSRTLDFADEIMRLTEGEGVDIVLNSLNKDYIPAGIRVLTRNGRFVELGKIGVWSSEQVHQVRPDVSYHNFDLSELDPNELIAVNKRILLTIAELLTKGFLRPLPTTVYNLDEVEEAFGVLSRGANTGKLVIAFAEQSAAPAAASAAVRPDRTYLITGGLGALGVVTAEKLTALGARHLVLMSRRAVPSGDMIQLEARLGADVRVSVFQGDVANAEDVGRLVATLRQGPLPLGGIVHAAGVLNDMPVAAQTWEHIDTVFRPKVYGTWLLHQAAKSFSQLRFFVGYSSVSAVLGPAAQANYAAGNAFIDTVMRWRAGQGLPGLSIGWGPWSDVGMAAKLGRLHAKSIESQGVGFLKPADGTRALFKVLEQPIAQIMVGEFDWDRYVATKPAASALYKQVASRGDDTTTRIDVDALASIPKTERIATVNELIRVKVAKVLHFEGADDVDPDAKFVELGLDSLVAVELKNALEAAFRIPLPTAIVFDYPSIDLLAGFLDEQLAPRTTEDGSTPGEDEDVRNLADADADAELAALRDL